MRLPVLRDQKLDICLRNPVEVLMLRGRKLALVPLQRSARSHAEFFRFLRGDIGQHLLRIPRPSHQRQKHALRRPSVPLVLFQPKATHNRDP